MPSPTENVFLALKEKKFSEIEVLIKSEPELVNAVNPKNGSSLFQSLFGLLKPTEESEALIRFIATHESFDFRYINPDVQITNLDKMVTYTRLDLFQLVIQNMAVIFNQAKLTYTSAKEYLPLIQKTLQKALAKNPDSPASARARIEASHAEEIVSLLRDATILLAIKLDDAELFDMLEKAGAKPSDRLGAYGKEKLPAHLLTVNNPNLKAWFQASLEKAVASTARNPHSFLNRAKEVDAIEKQLATLEIQHSLAKKDVKKQFVETELEILEQLKTASM